MHRMVLSGGTPFEANSTSRTQVACSVRTVNIERPSPSDDRKLNL